MNFRLIRWGVLIVMILGCMDQTVYSQKNDVSYGYSPENPIKVGKSKRGGLANERLFLELLRDEYEEPVSFKKLGSCCPYQLKNGGTAICDLFKIKFKDKKGKDHEVILYLTFYEYDKPTAPADFTIATQNIDIELQPVMDSVADIRHIKEIHIKSEKLKEIPDVIYEYAQLEVLWIDSNDITTFSPKIANLKRLKKLGFAGNAIKVLPDEFAQLDSLEEITLNKGMNWEPVFQTLARLGKLKRLNLSGAGIKSLPEGIQGCKILEEINLFNNPDLKLAEVFKQLAVLVNLKVLKLGNTPLTEMPAGLASLNKLEVFAFTASGIKQLPLEIGELSHLRVLDISSNNSLSSVPESVKQLSSLEEIHFNYMQPTFKYAEAITRFSDCKRVRKLSCKSGRGLLTLPAAIGKFKNLEELDLTMCSDLTALPKEIGELGKLKTLELGYDIKIKTLPAEIIQLKNLRFLDISGHSGLDFKKEFPKFCHLSSLQTIVINGGNQQIPESVKECKHVKVLWLKSYLSNYTIPAEKTRLKHLLPGCEINY